MNVMNRSRVVCCGSLKITFKCKKAHCAQFYKYRKRGLIANPLSKVIHNWPKLFAVTQKYCETVGQSDSHLPLDWFLDYIMRIIEYSVDEQV